MHRVTGVSMALRREVRRRPEAPARLLPHALRLVTPRTGYGSRWARGWPARSDACWSAGPGAARAPPCGSSPLISWMRIHSSADVHATGAGGSRYGCRSLTGLPLSPVSQACHCAIACAAGWAQDGQQELWPVVEQALGDDRLLLIVDGLDEWASEDAARTAARLLQVFVQADGIPVLAAGRPTGCGAWNCAAGGGASRRSPTSMPGSSGRSRGSGLRYG